MDSLYYLVDDLPKEGWMVPGGKISRRDDVQVGRQHVHVASKYKQIFNDIYLVQQKLPPQAI